MNTTDHTTTANPLGDFLNPSKATLVFLATFIGYALFALSTDVSSFGFRSAQEPARWMLWRHLVTDTWLFLAYGIFLLRSREIVGTSFKYALVAAGSVALILAGTWIGFSSDYAVLGSALIYSLLAGLLCATMRNRIAAGVLAAFLVIVQILVDIVALGFAGNFRLLH